MLTFVNNIMRAVGPPDAMVVNMPDGIYRRSLDYGLRLSLLNGVDDCQVFLEPHIKSDWEIFFTGVSWPSGEIKANVQFALVGDREAAYEKTKNEGATVILDESDRRTPRFEMNSDERRTGVDRRLKSGERVERPKSGRRELAGEIKTS
ncbi:MAG: hypothetical protein H8D70_01855 [Rhodospirillaceae bacterium]|nr:hypothetical protein [Rhodospirillaceae bacterium]